jgi:hypothetical protein
MSDEQLAALCHFDEGEIFKTNVLIIERHTKHEGLFFLKIPHIRSE